MTYADFLAFRRSLPRTPHLVSQRVRARGIDFAVFTSPPVPGEIPLVAINGGMIHDHSLLWPALSPLAARRQLILFDLRGRGASSAPADPMAATIDDDAADVGALRRALRIRRWDVLGHSIGGGIAMLAAADDAAGVRRLVLVDSVGPTSDWIEPLRRAVVVRLTGDERESVTKLSDSDFLSADPAVQSAYSRAVYPAWFADQDMARRFAPPDAVSQSGAAALARLRTEGYDWRPRLGGVSAQALVIHGEKDVLPAAVAFEIAQSLQHARAAIVPSAGHMPFWEAPEPFFSLIETFILRPTPGV
jgi:proline iminopeptidase